MANFYGSLAWGTLLCLCFTVWNGLLFPLTNAVIFQVGDGKTPAKILKGQRDALTAKLFGLRARIGRAESMRQDLLTKCGKYMDYDGSDIDKKEDAELFEKYRRELEVLYADSQMYREMTDLMQSFEEAEIKLGRKNISDADKNTYNRVLIAEAREFSRRGFVFTEQKLDQLLARYNGFLNNCGSFIRRVADSSEENQGVSQGGSGGNGIAPGTAPSKSDATGVPTGSGSDAAEKDGKGGDISGTSVADGFEDYKEFMRQLYHVQQCLTETMQLVKKIESKASEYDARTSNPQALEFKQRAEKVAKKANELQPRQAEYSAMCKLYRDYNDSIRNLSKANKEDEKKHAEALKTLMQALNKGNYSQSLEQLEPDYLLCREILMECQDLDKHPVGTVEEKRDVPIATGDTNTVISDLELVEDDEGITDHDTGVVPSGSTEEAAETEVTPTELTDEKAAAERGSHKNMREDSASSSESGYATLDLLAVNIFTLIQLVSLI
ncbi:uncharacterized protein BXIN_1205 [Babesia sp. Xinjiang]|uniref:uncharacterized protein n=1 Tax=Babesia sp. Xinjiang TaxID=462227 RepID=UPI000A237EEB|nr:uncharacterized protein BXIN_1205 [Babesia sp. Xinjiang]ORM40120.1 hypothetical protein BXIN_1205 [Babesia sp. Xinjiang]